jgi:hypothetical protein
MVPTCGLKDHATVVLVDPFTVGVKVALWPPVSDAVPGERVRLTVVVGAVGISVTKEVADLVESTTLAAMMVTV